MSSRRQEEERREGHRRRGLLLNVLFTAVSVVLVGYLVVMATHWPRVVAQGDYVVGGWGADISTEWETVSVEHDLDLGDTEMLWDVTREPHNETVRSGAQGSQDEGAVVVDLPAPGGYGIHLEPRGRTQFDEYSVVVREHYVPPSAVTAAGAFAASVLVLLTGVAGYVLLVPNLRRYQREYRVAWYVTLPLMSGAALAALAVAWLA